MKDQFLFVYSLLVIHTQQVFYSHKKPTIREWIHLQLVGNILIVLTCIYILYTYYIHIIHVDYLVIGIVGWIGIWIELNWIDEWIFGVIIYQ